MIFFKFQPSFSCYSFEKEILHQENNELYFQYKDFLNNFGMQVYDILYGEVE